MAKRSSKDMPLADEYAPIGRALDALRERGRSIEEAEPMAGDVSRRHYLRLRLGDFARSGRPATAVLAVYPEAVREVCGRALLTGRLLHEAGVRVPAILDVECDPAKGPAWMLLEDLGNRTLYDLGRADGVPWESVEPYFEDAVEQLPRIESLPRRMVADLNPPLDAGLLRAELRKTRTSYLDPVGLADGSAADRRTEAALDALCGHLGEEPPVPCHRDFGARNLVPIDPAERRSRPGSGLSAGSVPRVGVLDHQDLRLGPPRYDLASLLNDSLFPPPQAEERLLERSGVRSPEDRERYHRAAAQRTLKAVGSYAAYALEGFPRHVGLITPTLERCFAHMERVPETAEAGPELRRRWREATGGGPGM